MLPFFKKKLLFPRKQTCYPSEDLLLFFPEKLKLAENKAIDQQNDLIKRKN